MPVRSERHTLGAAEQGGGMIKRSGSGYPSPTKRKGDSKPPGEVSSLSRMAERAVAAVQAESSSSNNMAGASISKDATAPATLRGSEPGLSRITAGSNGAAGVGNNEGAQSALLDHPQIPPRISRHAASHKRGGLTWESLEEMSFEDLLSIETGAAPIVQMPLLPEIGASVLSGGKKHEEGAARPSKASGSALGPPQSSSKQKTAGEAASRRQPGAIGPLAGPKSTGAVVQTLQAPPHAPPGRTDPTSNALPRKPAKAAQRRKPPEATSHDAPRGDPLNAMPQQQLDTAPVASNPKPSRRPGSKVNDVGGKAVTSSNEEYAAYLLQVQAQQQQYMAFIQQQMQALGTSPGGAPTASQIGGGRGRGARKPPAVRSKQLLPPLE